MNAIKKLFFARIPYVHLLVGILLSAICLLLLFMLGFPLLFEMIYGNVKEEDVNPNVIYWMLYMGSIITLLPLLVLLVKNIWLKNYPYIKSYLLIIMITIIGFIYRLEIVDLIFG